MTFVLGLDPFQIYLERLQPRFFKLHSSERSPENRNATEKASAIVTEFSNLGHVYLNIDQIR